jgi:MFS family permease
MVTGGLIGNVIEWYDWFCYGLLASVFAGQIFPAKHPIDSILAVFAAYAVGFFVRPVASLILSPFGDRHGRRGLMALSVGLMGLAALVLAVTPTYAAVGILSPIILLAARLLQGLSAAGEYQSSISYILENSPQHRRGLISGLFNTSSGISILAATVSANLVTGLIPQPALAEWGWRLPFVFGALLSLFGLYLRMGIPESETFVEIKEHGDIVRSPLGTSLRRYPKQLLQIAAIQFVGVPYYLWSTFIPTYAHLVSHISLSLALTGNTIGLVVYLFALPTVGGLADRYGRKPFLLAGAVGLIVLVYPCVLLLHSPSFPAYLAASLIGWLLLSTIEALAPAVAVELLPPGTRVSGIGVPYQISTAVLAGTAPLIASWLISIGHPTYIAFYVMVIMAIGGLIYLTIPETKNLTVTAADASPQSLHPAAAPSTDPV